MNTRKYMEIGIGSAAQQVEVHWIYEFMKVSYFKYFSLCFSKYCDFSTQDQIKVRINKGINTCKMTKRYVMF